MAAEGIWSMEEKTTQHLWTGNPVGRLSLPGTENVCLVTVDYSYEPPVHAVAYMAGDSDHKANVSESDVERPAIEEWAD